MPYHARWSRTFTWSSFASAELAPREVHARFQDGFPVVAVEDGMAERMSRTCESITITYAVRHRTEYGQRSISRARWASPRSELQRARRATRAVRATVAAQADGGWFASVGRAGQAHSVAALALSPVHRPVCRLEQFAEVAAVAA